MVWSYEVLSVRERGQGDSGFDAMLLLRMAGCFDGSIGIIRGLILTPPDVGVMVKRHGCLMKRSLNDHETTAAWAKS
jgi:hypothetical protein